MTEAELHALLGARIKNLRLQKNISQIQLAVECGFERSNMSRIEAGRTNPTIGSLYKIAKALGVSLYELLKFD